MTYRQIRITEDMAGRPRLVFESAAERFHLWLDPVTLRPSPDSTLDARMTLYANPLVVTHPRCRTRHLDATAKAWAPVIARCLAGLDLDAVRAELAEAARVAAEAHAATVRRAAQQGRARDALDDLLALARDLATSYCGLDPQDCDVRCPHARARTLLATIDG